MRKYKRSRSCQLPGVTSTNAPCDHKSPRVTYVTKKASALASFSRYQIFELTGWSAVVSSISFKRAPPARSDEATTTNRARPGTPCVACMRILFTRLWPCVGPPRYRTALIAQSCTSFPRVPGDVSVSTQSVIARAFSTRSQFCCHEAPPALKWSMAKEPG